MTSFALDLTTICHALSELENKGIGGAGWQAHNPEQAQLLKWYGLNRTEIARLSGLTALASDQKDVLNSFLVAHGFQPKFDQLDGVGVVSVLDMLVKWLAECSVTSIIRVDRVARSMQRFAAFSMPTSGVKIYLTGANDSVEPLIKLETKSGDRLWLRQAPKPASGLELAAAAQQMLLSHRTPYPIKYAGVVVPMLDLNTDTNLDWLIGMSTAPDWNVSQANQQTKLRVDNYGAEVKVASSLGVTRSACIRPQPFTFREPFIGCFTQQGHSDLPIAAFWADFDSWCPQEGSLEEV